VSKIPTLRKVAVVVASLAATLVGGGTAFASSPATAAPVDPATGAHAQHTSAFKSTFKDIAVRAAYYYYYYHE
jgi:hypothetical protein